MKKYRGSTSGRTRLESTGMEILHNIHTHDKNYGGHYIECTAGTGKGKTALLLSTALYNLKKFPEEKVFFSECFDTSLQTVNKLGKDNVCFLLPKGSTVKFRDRNKKLIEVPYSNFNVVMYQGYEDLYEKAQVGKVNVPIFCDRREIMDFISYLRSSTGEFVLILIDEMSEIATWPPNGPLWQKNQDFATICKDLRKSFINLWYTAQNCSQVDYRVRASVDIKIFGPGAVSPNKNIVWQESIFSLEVDAEKGNEFYIVQDLGTFGLFRLTDIFKPLEGCNFGIYR